METNKKIKAFTDYLDSVNDDFLKEPEATTTGGILKALIDQYSNVGYDGSESSLQTYLKGGEFGAEWQKEKDKAIIDKLTGFIEEMTNRYEKSEWIAGEANKLLQSIK
jgi:hypothetical protein